LFGTGNAPACVVGDEVGTAVGEPLTDVAVGNGLVGTTDGVDVAVTVATGEEGIPPDVAVMVAAEATER
jgi:hypothetical protein